MVAIFNSPNFELFSGALQHPAQCGVSVWGLVLWRSHMWRAQLVCGQELERIDRGLVSAEFPSCMFLIHANSAFFTDGHQTKLIISARHFVFL